MTFQDTVLSYSERGWPVFPCRPNGKEPLVPGGFKSATCDREKLRSWLEHWPNANLAVATGAVSETFVLDIDVKNGADGEQSLQQLIAENGEPPETLIATTPGGGRHIFFKHPGLPIRNRAAIRPGLDVRGDGGYVLVAPSTVEGKPYEWVNPDARPASAPDWLLEMLSDSRVEAKGPRSHAQNAPGGWPEGQRNDGVFRYAASLRGKDVSRDEAERLVLEAADRCTPPLEHSEALACLDSVYERYEPNRTFPLTDAGNAERLVDRFGEYIRYVPGYGRWAVWNGAHWSLDQDGQIRRLAKKTVRDIPSEVSEEADADLVARFRKHASASENRNRLDAMTDLAASEKGISMAAADFDSDPWLFGCPNGTVDLRTGNFRDSEPTDYNMKVGGVAFDHQATCPKWHQFLNGVFKSKKELIDYVQRAVGYTITGQTIEDRLFIAYGIGANGKSTLFAVLEALLGNYAKSVASETLMMNRQRSSSGPSEDILRLKGARMASSNETEDGQVLAEALVKRLTGGDSIVARAPYAKDSIEFRPEFKLWFAANHLPIIRGSDHAIWRRIDPIPFTETFDGARNNPNLRKELLEELPGILNWAIEGALCWQQRGLDTPPIVKSAAEAYKEDMDRVGEWIQSNCQQSVEYRTPMNDLYADYVNWCACAHEKPMSRVALGRKLTTKGFEQYKSGVRGYEGIRIKPWTCGGVQLSAAS